MREEVKTLARHRLERAREAFAEGEQLLRTGAAMGATNRFYYAAFHAARALLATREVDASKHSGVIALFQRHFVRPGLIDTDVGRAFARAFEKRQKGDYADFAVVTLDEAAAIRQDVEAFVQACTSVLDRLIAEDQPQDGGSA